MTNAATEPNWTIRTNHPSIRHFSSKNHKIIEFRDFLNEPDCARNEAILQNFAQITPQYPGVRAALDSAVCEAWLTALSPLLADQFGPRDAQWSMRAWFSLVTTPPGELLPIQCFPHVDGTDPRQIAMMLYLHESPHGGTAFFRHHSSGLTALTAETFPAYRKALEADVARTGLPRPAYPTDGAPHFERLYASSGAFNSAVFYRGNILHSGIIDNAAPLPADPLEGRLTINAFFSPL
jgi:hypothetical protein